MDAIATRNLTKVYRGHIGRGAVRSLDSLTLTIAPNEVFGFLGRNGAGKTTTIKILCSLLRATTGEAFVMGQDTRRRETRKHIGYLPENPYFYEYLNPRETLDFYGNSMGSPALNARPNGTGWPICWICGTSPASASAGFRKACASGWGCRCAGGQSPRAHPRRTDVGSRSARPPVDPRTDPVASRAGQDHLLQLARAGRRRADLQPCGILVREVDHTGPPRRTCSTAGSTG